MTPYRAKPCGPIAFLRERAERVETFGGPDAAVLARDVAQRVGSPEVPLPSSRDTAWSLLT